MREYEINYLILQSKTEGVDKIREEMKKFITKFKGEVKDSIEYKKRKLAYEIDHERYGFYTALRFELKDGSVLSEIREDLNLNSDIARYIIVRADELPSLKSAQRSNEEKSSKTVKQADLEKMLADEKISSSKSADTKEDKADKEDEVKTKSKKEAEEEIEKEVKKKKEAEEKRSIKKEEGEEKETRKKQDKSSLDELDKKLEEILDI